MRRACSVAALAALTLAALTLSAAVHGQSEPVVPGTTPENSPAGAPVAPDWAYPDSPGHHQVPPPVGFHRPARIDPRPIGIFGARADVGGTLVPGSATLANGRYTITSAGYNVWYTRDEAHFVYRKLSGDFTLASDIAFPVPTGFGDRKAMIMVRQSLDDDAAMAAVSLHSTGMYAMAWRPAAGQSVVDVEYKLGSRGGVPGTPGPDGLIVLHPPRLGLARHGDDLTLLASNQGEPLHPVGTPIHLHFSGPVYVGLAFVSHLPTTPDRVELSNVVLETGHAKH